MHVLFLEDDLLIDVTATPCPVQGSTSCVEDEPLDIKCYEAKLRRKLKFFFMNPIEKWQTKKRFPYKFLVQIIKILLVTFQVIIIIVNF